MSLMVIMVLTVMLTILLVTACRVLPGEKWQFLGTVPDRKISDRVWDGINLTWYGLLTANAYTFAVAVWIVLTGSLFVYPAVTVAVAVVLLAVCMPASRWVARIVEKKPYTFSVGGASFVGMIMAPWVMMAVIRIQDPTASGASMVIPMMAALSIAYAFGEGMGRLACISFGCCYGRPLDKASPWIRRLFDRWAFVFYGHTRKIAYADRLDGKKVIPVQALTYAVNCGAGLIGMGCFLYGNFALSFVAGLTITQLWRFVSEFLRADYRGNRHISIYQYMTLVSIAYGLAITVLFPVDIRMTVDIAGGLKGLWNPALILGLQLLWLVTFVYTGRSRVTGATISFRVHRDRV